MPDDAAPDPKDEAKRAAALRACALVEDGMRVGLGTGSTAVHRVRRLGERARGEGLRLRCVPTSDRTAALARAVGLSVTALEDVGRLDLTIDGADEADDDGTLIKGGGGALLREKIVAAASDRFVMVADAEKRVDVLGRFPLPVEVSAFGWTATRDLIDEVLAGQDVDGHGIAPRETAFGPYRTDGGNLILDLSLRRIGSPRRLAAALLAVPGVVETGLFLDMTDVMMFGRTDGGVDVVALDG